MDNLKKIAQKIISTKNLVVASMVGVYIALSTSPAFASGFKLNGNASAETIGNTAISKTEGVLRIVGGVCIVLSLAIAAIGLITTRNRPDKRQEIISGIGWILVGGFMLGSLMVLSTFVFNIGK